ncbi:toxin CptA [Dyella sp. OK004]|uniref:protein YgfX n=1 Tax=Dyella sp. OK004 TaxID=1855292 RepID=UPI0008EFE938|nr:protein YgfX [Dyella sp. OK004]SFS12428.1 toxin CptA [Dyella sp. OK004]
MTSAPAIGFEYRPSRLFGRCLVAMAGLAGLAVVLAGVGLWLKALLLAGVGIALFRVLAAQAQQPVRAAGWAADGNWGLRLHQGQDVVAVLLSFRVLGMFLLLRLRSTEGREAALLLAPDNSDADLRRRLRMRLATVKSEEATPRF